MVRRADILCAFSLFPLCLWSQENAQEQSTVSDTHIQACIALLAYSGPQATDDGEWARLGCSAVITEFYDLEESQDETQ